MSEIVTIILSLLSQSKVIAQYAQYVPAAFKTGQELYNLVLRLIVIAKHKGLLTPGEEAKLDQEINDEQYKDYQQINPDPVDSGIPLPEPPPTH